MCFITCPSKKKSTKSTPKAKPEATHINLTFQGASFSFLTSDPNLPSNFFIRQDFYWPDTKTQTSNSAPALSYNPYIPSPPTYAAWPHLASAASYTGADLAAAVSETQHLACTLKHACASNSSCSSSSRSSRRSSSYDRERNCDREILPLTLEHRNAEDIAVLKLERDIESRVRDVIRDRDIQTLMRAAGPGGAAWRGYGVGGGGDGGSGDRYARAVLESENRLLWWREREQEREKGREKDSEMVRRLISAGRADAYADAQMQINLYQDLSGGGCMGERRERGRGEGEFVDGFKDGWERRRSSVVSTLDEEARRLAETMARVEAEVEFIRRRGRGGERVRGYL